MKKLKVAMAAFLALGTVFSFGCTTESEYSTLGTDGYILNTYYNLIITDCFGDSQKKESMEKLCADVYDLLIRFEQSVSTLVETSSVYAFNEAAPGATVEIDKTAYEILTLAMDMYEFTEGYYNPAVYSSVDLYGFAPRPADTAEKYDEKGEDGLPKPEYVEAFQSLATHFKDVVLEQKDGKYYATKPADAFVVVEDMVWPMKLSLSGIGKGYITDAIDAMIDEAGFTNGYFNFGSSSMAVKNSYSSDDGYYRLGFRDARGTGSYFSSYIKDVCLSTSGDYETYYELNGVRYCHIIDPTTGSPVNTGIMTATVIGGTAAAADALTTALMAMGGESAVHFINEKLSGLSVVLAVEGDGGYGVITNLTADYAVLNENYTLLSAVDENGKIVYNG